MSNPPRHRKGVDGRRWGVPDRDEHGRPVCRGCAAPVPKGRRTFCSDGCVDEWKIRTSGAAAAAATFKRDHGVCAACGTDTLWLSEAIRHLARVDRPLAFGIVRAMGYVPRSTIRFLAEQRRRQEREGRNIGVQWEPLPTSWWEADHIVPVVEGGGQCGLDNLRTLCVPCHRAETKALATRRAAERRDARAALFRSADA